MTQPETGAQTPTVTNVEEVLRAGEPRPKERAVGEPSPAAERQVVPQKGGALRQLTRIILREGDST